MATSQTFTYADNSTVTNYKGWCQAISNAFSTFGWSKASDTGTVVWANVTTVPGTSTYRDWEIWMMADTLQSSNPVYVKVEYGTGGSAAYPSLAITVGSGSNGTGTLTNAGTRSILGPTSATGGASQTYECDFSGANNRIAFTMWRGYTNPITFTIERSHDTNGNDTNSYITCLVAGNNLATPFCYQQTIMPVANGGPLFYEKYGLTVQTTNTTAMYSNSVAVAPFWPFVGKLDNPLLAALCIKAGDFADGAQFSATMYGASHNYLVTKSYSGTLWANSTTNSIAIRYE